jgi:UPF0176 protein
VEKVYVARVVGQPSEKEFSCSAPISVEPGDNGLRVIREDGQSAETHFTTLERFGDGTSLVEARPVTGRTNQIRLHLWHLGLPICGDPIYLPNGITGAGQTPDVGERPLCLHSRSIQFVHPKSKEPIVFEAPLPGWSRE